MTTKKKSSAPTLAKTKVQKRSDDDAYIFSEDALNIARIRLPSGYTRIIIEQPDEAVATNEIHELIEKVAPKILGDGEMAWVYHYYTFHNESIGSIARKLSGMGSRKYSTSRVKTLLTQAQGRMRVFFDETVKDIKK